MRVRGPGQGRRSSPAASRRRRQAVEVGRRQAPGRRPTGSRRPRVRRAGGHPGRPPDPCPPRRRGVPRWARSAVRQREQDHGDDGRQGEAELDGHHASVVHQSSAGWAPRAGSSYPLLSRLIARGRARGPDRRVESVPALRQETTPFALRAHRNPRVGQPSAVSQMQGDGPDREARLSSDRPATLSAWPDPRAARSRGKWRIR